MKIGSMLMREIGKKKAICRSYFNFVDSRFEEMMTLTLNEIEVGYHEGEKLPETEDECFAVKELVVHPATVFILSKPTQHSSDTRERMKAEIDEVLEHLNLL
jgi:hypothetical protein